MQKAKTYQTTYVQVHITYCIHTGTVVDMKGVILIDTIVCVVHKVLYMCLCTQTEVGVWRHSFPEGMPDCCSVFAEHLRLYGFADNQPSGTQ